MASVIRVRISMQRTLGQRVLSVLTLTILVLPGRAGLAQYAGPVIENGPLLFFASSDIPAIHRKIGTGKYAALWKQASDDARNYCDPKSVDYADPINYLKDLETGTFANGRSGRQLTTWIQAIGFVYEITGDKVYAGHGIALLDTAARNLPVSCKIMDGRVGTPYGDMMRAFATGLDLLGGAMTPEQRKVIAQTARGYILRHIADYNAPKSPWGPSQPHNYNGVCGGALGLLALALRKDYPDDAPAWIKLGEKISLDWLHAGFDRDGAYYEGVLYMQYGLGNIAILADALQRYSGDRQLITALQGKGISSFMAMEKLPGEEEYDARNDSLYTISLSGRGGICSPYLLQMASGFGGIAAPDSIAAWLWRGAGAQKGNEALQIVWGNDAAAQSPEMGLAQPYGAYYPDRGLCVWRTGWGRKDTMFSIEAGPYHPVTHNQADKGHFNFYTLGYRWAADTGYGNNREPEGRCQTVAHSCVLIDGKGQALTGAALGTDGKVLRYENNPRYGYAALDCKSAYNHNNGGGQGVPLDKALRHVFFIRPSKAAPDVPAYAVVLDDMDWSGQTHQYTWQMITWQDMKIENDGTSTFTLKAGGVPADPTMKVIISASAPLALTDDVYIPDNHGGVGPNTYRRIRATATTSNPRFVAVLAPLPARAREPKLTVADFQGGKLISIDWGVRTDEISWQGNQAQLMD